MLRKSTILAVAATAALGFSMLSSSANARGFGGGFHGGGFHGVHGGRMGPRFAGRQFHPGWRHWHVNHWHRPIFYGYGYGYGVRTVGYAPQPVAGPGPCTCLSKEYTPEGAVLFKDRCTNEMAMNPPEPQQTGQADEQQQTAQYQQQYVQPRPQPR